MRAIVNYFLLLYVWSEMGSDSSILNPQSWICCLSDFMLAPIHRNSAESLIGIMLGMHCAGSIVSDGEQPSWGTEVLLGGKG